MLWRIVPIRQMTAAASSQRLPELPERLPLVLQGDVRVDRHRDLDIRMADDLADHMRRRSKIKAAALRFAASALPAPRSGLRPRAHGRARPKQPADWPGRLIPFPRLSGVDRNPSRALRVACSDGLRPLPTESGRESLVAGAIGDGSGSGMKLSTAAWMRRGHPATATAQLELAGVRLVHSTLLFRRIEVILDRDAGEHLAVGDTNTIDVWLGLAAPGSPDKHSPPEAIAVADQPVAVFRGDYRVGVLDAEGSAA